MLVTNVSMVPRRTVAAIIAEAGAASDTITTASGIVASIDEAASSGSIVNAYLGELMAEAVSAADTVTVGLSYGVLVDEPASIADLFSGTTGVVSGAVDETATAVDTPDATITSAPGAWELVDSWTYSGNVAQVDFTGLAGYTDVRVLIRLASSIAGVRNLRVSTDNGASFLAASGDYIDITSAGVETNQTTIQFISVGSPAGALSAEVIINGWNLTAIKVAQCRTPTTYRQYIIPTSSPLNALRIIDGTITGGSIYVFAR